MKKGALSRPPRVFISYARSDGESFAVELCTRLEAEEPAILLWQDRSRMEGGVGWWKQITDALDLVQFLIVVMTPAAIKSETTRKEWRYARQKGVCICPVKGVLNSELDYDSLPNWMRKVHFYDLEHEWETFVLYLKSPCHIPRAPFMAPDIPNGFVDRPREFDQILMKLMDSDRHDPIAITTALQGAGGFGKTTLAVALCHHDDVLTAFDDGILWVTLGENPNVRDGLLKLYAAITGERPPFVDEEDAAFHLAERLKDRNCLMVIDDVWDLVHLRPFLRGGDECARIITTRQVGIAVSANAEPVRVDEMTWEESIRMLTKGLKVQPTSPAPFLRLAQHLGQWPLLLELANAALRQRLSLGDTVDKAFDYLSRAMEKRGVTAFDRRNPVERNQAVSRTIEVSLGLLTREERERCIELGIFPEDTDISITTAASLWGFDSFDTEELITRLDDLSLLKFDPGFATFCLHDVMRSYLLSRMSNPPALHGRLTDAWEDKDHLPDQYAWRWIGYHLREGERTQELRDLLFDFNWLEKKLQATDMNSLIHDFLWTEEDKPLRLVREALTLSAHVLACDKHQLAGQLLGRLLGHEDAEREIRSLLNSTRKWKGAPWLRPLSHSLTPPGGPLIRTLSGHARAVNSITLSLDKTRALSASWDNTVKVWDLERGMELRTLKGHTSVVNSVAVRADGKVALSASSDNTVKVWDVERGMELRTLKGHTSVVNSVAVRTDGKVALSASSDNTVKVWDVERGMELRTLKAHTNGVNSVVISADGKVALSASWDCTVKVWDVERGVERETFTGHTNVVNCVAISSDAKLALSASSDHTVKIWDVVRRVELVSLKGHSGWVKSVAISADGKLALSASSDGMVRVWDVERGVELGTLTGHTNGVNAVVISADGKLALSASADSTIKVWNVDRRVELKVFTGHTDEVESVVISADGKIALSASSDGMLKVWDLMRGVELRSFKGHTSGVNSVVVSTDGKIALTASTDCTVKVWDLEKGVELRTLTGHTKWVQSVAASIDGKIALTASTDCTVKVWDLERGVELRTLTGHSSWVNSVAVDGEGKLAVSASSDGTVKVWEVASGKKLKTFTGHTREVTSVTLSVDGKLALSASWDNTIKVWDVERGMEVRTLRGHASGVRYVRISRDGLLALSASFDNTVKLWELETGEIVASFELEGSALCCAIAPDSRLFVAGDAAGRVHFLRLEGI